MADIFEIASDVSTPLALAGLTAVAFFMVVRQALAKGLFPVMSQKVGGHLFKTILDYLFVLALVAMCLGFLGYIVVKLVEGQHRRGSVTEESSAHNQSVKPGKLLLRGEILDEATGMPLAGVLVALPEYRMQQVTDSVGQYRFEVPSQDGSLVKLRATKGGFRPINLDTYPGTSHLNTHRMRRIQ